MPRHSTNPENNCIELKETEIKQSRSILGIIVHTLMRTFSYITSLQYIHRSPFRRDLYRIISHPYALSIFRKQQYADIPNSAQECQIRNILEIKELLQNNGIPYFWIPIRKIGDFKTRLAINICHSEQFFKIITSTDKLLNLTLKSKFTNIHWNPKLFPYRKYQGRYNLIIWEFHKDYGNRWINEISYTTSCEIEFFTEEEETYTLTFANDITKIIDKDQPITEKGIFNTKLTTWEVMTEEQSLETSEFDIDIIYTWVDGGDEKWLSEKENYLNASKELHPESYNNARFKSRDELKYSLRSLSFFTNFVRNIYIVTNGQTPSWLNTNHPKIKIIDHKDIFRHPETSLPTYNSHAIESNIHRIKELSNHYIYLNDDMLFCRSISRNIFFNRNGIASIFINKSNNFGFYKSKPNNNASPFDMAGRNTVNIMRRLSGKIFSSSILHSPYCNQKSVTEELEEKICDELKTTESNKFRSKNDISLPASLALAWALYTGRAIEGELETSTINISDNIAMELSLLSLLTYRNKDFICINDSPKYRPENGENLNRKINYFFENYYPLKCEFEK